MKNTTTNPSTTWTQDTAAQPLMPIFADRGRLVAPACSLKQRTGRLAPTAVRFAGAAIATGAAAAHVAKGRYPGTSVWRPPSC